MKYNVGDRVRIKSLDWYRKYANKNGTIVCGNYYFTQNMLKYCGKVLMITNVIRDFYVCEYINYQFSDEMIEGLVEEERNACQKCVFAVYDDKPHCGLRGFRSDFNVERCSEENDIIPNGYELQEDGYFSWVDKKKEYPKTYEECCKVLNLPVRDLDILDNMLDTTEIIYSKNLDRLLNLFRKLLICRDAYWKIAGEEMGLGKPWEPNDADYVTGRYCIFVHRGNIICSTPAEDCPLTFPTEEMRDSFYENFKELIEQCKELL